MSRLRSILLAAAAVLVSSGCSLGDPDASIQPTSVASLYTKVTVWSSVSDVSAPAASPGDEDRLDGQPVAETVP